MKHNTAIEWTHIPGFKGETWNPIVGCSVISPGCTNCYAMRVAGARLDGNPKTPHYAGTTKASKAGPVWTGKVAMSSERALTRPLRWTKPRAIFVNSMGDLFHESVPDAWIDQVFAIMALCPQHIFIVLTKRAERMQEYVSHEDLGMRLSVACGNMLDGEWIWRDGKRHRPAIDRLIHAFAGWQQGEDDDYPDADEQGYLPDPMPLPNVWLGVSVEDQTRADERIPHLLATPAAVRFVSAEPLLGPVDLRMWLPDCYECGATCGLRTPGIPEIERCTECGEECGPNTEPVFSDGCPKCSGELEPVCPDCGHYMVYQHPDTVCLDWVIAGGESGHSARPMHPDWARGLRDQCKAAAVPFFFKQWGSHSLHEYGEDGAFTPPMPADRLDRMQVWNGEHFAAPAKGTGVWDAFKPGAVIALPASKRAAGHLLDGETHHNWPDVG